MSSKDDRDHYDRPSWKEIDQKKDGRSDSSSGDAQKSKKQMHRNKIAKKEYLKDLDNMFKGDKGTLDHYELLQKLKTQQTGQVFKTNIDKYLDLYGMPEDFEVLGAMLELSDLKLVKEAIFLIVHYSEDIPNNLKDLLKMKVDLLKMTSTDKELIKLLDQVKL
ncbi:MAG: hypothetical protein ABIA04_07355 [Pseudomonadota bacterium]